uniref:Uncharacterized protein n=1 Tax=Papilio xuthus TaxID=66420 RepID=I4DNM7_PAPXU|nr:unknown unsecreted protein [Papilio xuthus]
MYMIKHYSMYYVIYMRLFLLLSTTEIICRAFKFKCFCLTNNTILRKPSSCPLFPLRGIKNNSIISIALITQDNVASQQ